MRQRPPSPPPDSASGADDFDWPPTADNLSVYDIGPDPWHALQDVASDTFAERHGDRSRRQAEEARLETQRLAGVLTAVALIAAVAGWVLYRGMTRPAAVERVHHPAPAAAPAAASTAPPPRLRIVATYPVDPTEPVSDRTAPEAAVPAPLDGSTADTPAPPVTSLPPAIAVAPAGADALAGMTGVAVPAAAAPLAGSTEIGPSTGGVASTAVAASGTVASTGTRSASTGARSPDDSIRTLLQRYEDAYDQRDVRTAAALWPSLDQRALARAFAGLDRQDVEFDRCHIEASDAKGSAVCVGTVRYVPSVGRAVERADRITWTFDLARSGEDWRIDGLTAQ